MCACVRLSVGSNTPVGSVHALASTVIAFESRDALRGGEEKGERERERERARTEGETTRPGEEGIIPSHSALTAAKAAVCVQTMSGKYPGGGGAKPKQLVSSVHPPTSRNISAGGGSGVAASFVVSKVWSGTNRGLWGWFQVIPGEDKEYS